MNTELDTLCAAQLYEYEIARLRHALFSISIKAAEYAATGNGQGAVLLRMATDALGAKDEQESADGEAA